MRMMYLLLCLAVSVAAQSPPSKSSLQVGGERLVASDSQYRALVEPHLAVDSSKPNHWLVGVIVIAGDYSHQDCAALTSHDGGKTWSRHDFGLYQCADPWVAFLADGTALFTLLATRTKAQEGIELLVYRSNNAGRTWSEPVSLGPGHDHQTIALDRSGGARDGTLYVTSALDGRESVTGKVRPILFVARSRDGGRSFGPPVRLFPGSLQVNAMNPVVLSDGMLVASFADFGYRRLDGSLRLERERSWILLSGDGAQSFSAPIFISESCARSWGWLETVSSGPFRDRLFWLCTDGSYENILFQYSPDLGERWSKPVAVNRGSGTRPYVRTPMMAVSPEGVVGVSWYDGRNDRAAFKGNFRCQEFFFTVSLDGGESFLPEVKVSGGKSCPLTPKNGEVGLRFPAGGDYSGLVAAPGGRFHLVWSDSRNGVFELWTATAIVKAQE